MPVVRRLTEKIRRGVREGQLPSSPCIGGGLDLPIYRRPARLSNESRASVDSPPAPTCPSTLDDGIHLGSPGSPLGASLPTDLRSQSCSSRCLSWELCYVPRPPPSESRPWWNGPVQPAINIYPTPLFFSIVLVFFRSLSVILDSACPLLTTRSPDASSPVRPANLLRNACRCRVLSQTVGQSSSVGQERMNQIFGRLDG
jgi:hypothetical protein